MSVRLIEIGEDNWTSFLRLSAHEAQRAYVADPVGILARAYVYREQHARVFGIESDGTIVGMAMVRDLDEEPACYELQQFLVDARYQNRGIGSEALQKILSILQEERRYDCVEVCVKAADEQAQHVYEKNGFTDTGYLDPDCPDCIILMRKL